MMGKAKKVSADVETTVTYLESAEGKKLSDKARAVKVTAAIKELQGLQEDFQLSAVSSKEELLKKLKAEQEAAAQQEMVANVLNVAKTLNDVKPATQKPA